MSIYTVKESEAPLVTGKERFHIDEWILLLWPFFSLNIVV